MGKSTNLDEHLFEAFIENVLFLRSHGLSDSNICERLDVSRQVFEKRMERAGVPIGGAA